MLDSFSSFYDFAYEHQLLVGIPLGVLTAYLTLWFSHYLLAPKLIFSEDVRRITPRNKEPLYLYSIKVRNRNKRKLIDVSVRCRLAIHDIAERKVDLWTYFNIEVNPNIIQSYGKGYQIFHINVNTLQNNLLIYLLRKDFGDEMDAGTLRIEDVFLRHKRVKLQFFFVGHDEFTGVKKLYTSPAYCLHNIYRGKWNWLKLERSRGHKSP